MSEEQNISLFATIGSVYTDGVTLIFDGESSASTKRYLVNTSIKFKSGDRVKILPDSGTYVVEYVVGSPKLTSDETHELPTGGTDGQSLLKVGSAAYSVKWGTPDGILPTGGTAGQVLKKSSGTNYAAAWGDPPAAGSVANQYRPTYESYNIYLQTDYSGNFYIRQGTSGTWKKISVE